MGQALDAMRARLRAEDLLRSCLDTQQQQDYAKMKSFLVQGSERGLYRVCWHYVYQVGSGRIFCIVPVDRDLPPPDTMLVLKLLIQSDEDQFLSIANNGRYRRPWWRRWWGRLRKRSYGTTATRNSR